MQMPDVHALRDRIESERSCGQVSLFVEQRPQKDFPNVFQLLDYFTGGHGFRRIGDKWREVTRDFAERTLVWLLSRDLAYRAPLMSPSLATELATEFLAWFRDDATFFTNYLVNRDETAVMNGLSPCTGTPITDATFDAGILVVDSALLGILWFADED
jgi:hypothetical protein